MFMNIEILITLVFEKFDKSSEFLMHKNFHLIHIQIITLKLKELVLNNAFEKMCQF
jgi:hypothetical protein